MLMDNIVDLNSRRPKPVDPWRHNQPVLIDKPGNREELWSHPYFGISLLIWAAGSNNVPEPPTTGGTPKVANVATYRKLKAVAA
jgi:hypothetical protein